MDHADGFGVVADCRPLLRVPIPLRGELALIISATRSCSSRTSCIISGLQGPGRPVARRRSPIGLPSQIRLGQPRPVPPKANVSPSPTPVLNERSEFKRLFEKKTRHTQGKYVTFSLLRRRCTGPAERGRLVQKLHFPGRERLRMWETVSPKRLGTGPIRLSDRGDS